MSATMAVYAACAGLHVLLPAREVEGYACDRRGKPLVYRLNGLRVLAAVVAGWAVLCATDVIYGATIAEHAWGNAMAANVLGLLASAAAFVRGLPRKEVYSRCSTRDRPVEPQASEADLDAARRRGFLADFYLGLEFNPRLGRLFDIKMFLYLAGAVMLALNVLSAASLQRDQDGELSWAMAVYVAMLGWFICEYLYFEEIHLYTYDLFCERVGFKLVWGCLCFYANFYCIGVWPVVAHRKGVDLTPWQVAGTLALFYSGWMLTRGANMQKFFFKQFPASTSCFRGMIQQRTVPKSRLLCSGFWGLSRHVNYFGEILQAVALSLPGFWVSGSLLPFLYPAYYVALFIPRQIDDEAICAAKYGEAWQEYVRRVPYRIVPGVY